MYPPTPGTIRFAGADITRRTALCQRVQRGMSIKMQAPSVFKESAGPAEHPRSRCKAPRPAASSTTRRTGCSTCSTSSDDADKLAGALSHGQQQWLEIGMALALQPKLLLLDEPTAGMSPEETYQTGELIQSLERQGMTMLVVEHDMAFVRQIAQRVTVLHLRPGVRAWRRSEEIIRDPRVAEIYLGKTHHA